jgi:6-phosphofructo-2-kinase/fructose-2,6-biphosphatase
LKRSDSGKLYAKKLASFVEKRLKSEKAASVSTTNKQQYLGF